MKNFTIAATAVFVIATVTPAMAQDAREAATINSIIATETERTEIINSNPIINAVCNASFILSERATDVCNGNEAAPDMIADGSRLSNRGVGAEFNTLHRQLDG